MTAATLVAAVFICFLFFKNDFLYHFLKNQIDNLKLQENRIELSRLSNNEFGLDIVTKDLVPIFSSRWTPDWSLFKHGLQLSGQIHYAKSEAVVRLGIPFSLSFRPISQIHFDLNGNFHKFPWSATGLLEHTQGFWMGTAQTAFSHPQWGEFSPELRIKWGQSSELNLELKPSQIKSSLIRLETDAKLILEQKNEAFNGSLDFESLILKLSSPIFFGETRELKVRNTSLYFRNISPNKYGFNGTVDSMVLDPNLSSHLKDVFCSSDFGGEFSFDEKDGPYLDLKGQIVDSLKSLKVPFALTFDKTNLNISADVDCNLYEGSFGDLLLKEFISGAKLIKGKLKGSLRNSNFTIQVQPTSFLMKDFLLTGIQGNGVGDTTTSSFLLRNAQFGFADGLVKIKPFTHSLKSKETFLEFTAEGLQLKKILNNFLKGKLDGNGSFRGRGRLAFGSQGVFVSALHLENSTPGTISYLDATQPFFEKSVVFLDDFQDLLAQGQQALVLKALENFQYTSFKCDAERTSADRMKLLLNLKGKNPDLAKGQPFDITLPIEGNLESLVEGSLLERPVTDELHKHHIETE